MNEDQPNKYDDLILQTLNNLTHKTEKNSRMLTQVMVDVQDLKSKSRMEASAFGFVAGIIPSLVTIFVETLYKK